MNTIAATVQFGLLGLGLAWIVPALAAEPPANEDFPPVEHASFHQLLFSDADVAILNNLYPPSGDSGFHAHYHDLFYVAIQTSASTGQAFGQALKPGPTLKVGAAGLSTIEGERRVHRVINSDQGPMQFIVIELRRPKPRGDTIASRGSGPQYEQIVDHPRLRAWRLVLQPGQTAAEIEQAGKGVRVVVRGGLLTTIRPGAPDQTLLIASGDAAVQEPGQKRALKNPGKSTIELVEIELK